jgi:hypothetical protein
MITTPAPTIGPQHELYSACWHALGREQSTQEGWRLYEQMQAIEGWAATAVPATHREQEQLAAIEFAATGALAAGVFLKAA